jgi:acetoin utilization deacetylase AcuC-like enzyme
MPDSVVPQAFTGPLSTVWVVTDAATRQHDPGAEIWVGVPTPGTEVAARVTAIREVLAALGARTTGLREYDDEVLLQVHSSDVVTYLREAHARWLRGPYVELVGQDRVVPYAFPTASMLGRMTSRRPTATHALAGHFCYDTMTLIGPGTWPSVRASVAAAQTAAELALEGWPAYALCRPPGHHATTSGFGGSCYLNNAAVAAQAMRAAGVERVAVLDIDAHHGNGTQEVFWDRGDVFYGSVHVDPGAGWFPHFVGYADEVGVDAGLGATRNICLSEGSGDMAFLGAVTDLVERAERLGAQAVVVSLGVDAAAGDPEAPLRVTEEGFRGAGGLIAELGVPTAFVQEGGYRLDTLGALVASVLSGFVRAR